MNKFMMELNIKNFYNGKILFVTGATGFVGKVSSINNVDTIKNSYCFT